MSSTPGSPTRSPEPIRRAAVITHSRPEVIGDALDRLAAVAQRLGVELVDPERSEPQLAVVLGGDGTMLEGLKRFLGTGVPVVGVNFGNVGFLTSVPAGELEHGLERVYRGDFRVIELRTLAVDVAGQRHDAVNDAVLRSSVLGRMVELSWSLGGEDLGRVPCDGMICATPAGSTAYNLSNGGPVLVWGLEAMAVSFLAPHSLHARPIVVPSGLDLEIGNLTPDLSTTVLVDGRPVGELQTSDSVSIRVGAQASLLATLPEVTFFRRYRETFTHFRQPGPPARS